MGDSTEERIIMTPLKKTGCSTKLRMERRQIAVETSSQMHVAGGDHKGIVINKQTAGNESDISSVAQVTLEFRVFLVSAATGLHTKESRTLGFWFKDGIPERDQPTLAQDFFKTLVSPQDFPRDYVGFIKKIMKLMQNQYPQFSKIEVELKQLEESSELPPSAAKRGTILFTLGTGNGGNKPAEALTMGHPSTQKVELTEAKVLEMIESAYPNPLSVADMAKQVQHEDAQVAKFIQSLQDKQLVKLIGPDTYTRVVQNEKNVKVVKQMPKMLKAKQPTIAIITAQYCEKLAVDVMMENTETFVRYTTVGESNVYTLGNIGGHRVVCTKLPSVGHTREAMIAAGSTTTRLLGTFQEVEHVFLVGVGGGVPHYTDYQKHVRLGDVVASVPLDNITQKYIYCYCETGPTATDSGFNFDTRTWCPPTFTLQDIAKKLKEEADVNMAESPMVKYMAQGLSELEAHGVDFSRPSAETDKLYMSLGGNDVIEVAHPSPPEGSKLNGAFPSIHLGPIAAGRQVARDDQLRQHFSQRYGILAFDSEFDAVVESVYGNRKDAYMLIRGVADYKDGTWKKEWQPYAALAAAAFTRTVIEGMEVPPEDD